MPSQTSYFHNDVLAAASTDGSLHTLFWYINAEFPKRMVPAGIKRNQPAQYPPGCIPVVPAGPDPDTQREWAHLLAGIFEHANSGRGIVFKPMLTTVDLMSGLHCYEWGDLPPTFDVDHICTTCGQISRAPRGQAPRCECYSW